MIHLITRQFDIVLSTKILKTLSSNMVVTQNDKDVNLLKIRVFNGAEEINYSQISRGEIYFEKRDKNVVQGNLEKVTDGFTYQMGTNEIACTGEVLAIIHLYGSSGERLSTSKFKFTVERDLENENAIKSSSQYAALQKIIVDFNEAFSDIINGISEEIPEIIQARHDSVRNKTFNNLRERLDQDSFDIDENANKIGNLSEMTTTEKTNLAGAVNEVKNEITSHKEEKATQKQVHGMMIQSGSVTISNVEAGAIRSATITFPLAFANTPIVLTAVDTVDPNKYGRTSVSGRTSTGVTIHWYNGSTVSTAISVRWIAIVL